MVILFFALNLVDVNASYRETLSVALETDLGIVETAVIVQITHTRVQNQTTGSFHIDHFWTHKKAPRQTAGQKKTLETSNEHYDDGVACWATAFLRSCPIAISSCPAGTAPFKV